MHDSPLQCFPHVGTVAVVIYMCCCWTLAAVRSARWQTCLNHLLHLLPLWPPEQRILGTSPGTISGCAPWFACAPTWWRLSVGAYGVFTIV